MRTAPDEDIRDNEYRPDLVGRRSIGTRAQRKADAPYREVMAAKRLAKMARAERRSTRSMERQKRG